MKKKILLIGTGGTIACKQTEYGLAPSFTSEELYALMKAVKPHIPTVALRGI